MSEKKPELKLRSAKDIAKHGGIELEQLLRMASGSGAVYYPVSNLITMSHSPDMPYGDDMMIRIVRQMLCVDVSWIKLPQRIANKLACEKVVIIQTINMRDVKSGFFEPYLSGNPEHPWLTGDEQHLNHWEENKLLYLSEPIAVRQDNVYFDVHSYDFQHCMSALDFERFIFSEADPEESLSFDYAFVLTEWVAATPPGEEAIKNWLGGDYDQKHFNTPVFEKKARKILKKVSEWDSAFAESTKTSKPVNEVVSYMVNLVVGARYSETDSDTRECFDGLLDRMRDAFDEYVPEAFDFGKNFDTEGQRKAILIEIDRLGYGPLQVPTGGKSKLMSIVTKKYNLTKSQFGSRWKELRKEGSVKSLVKTGR